ncbi:MAG: oxygen-insensitive NAD(P)H nitroreductase [Alphaproteobacteria bacterium]|nr:oxygen-insensitive NAD(P)H nitroreductase [Alphaproteobacteria bacterium]
MSIIDSANKRYATKSFDEAKKISINEAKALKDLLRLAPSSVNSQPWHFIVANTDKGKQRIAKSTHGAFEFNLQKILKASHVVAFCAKTDFDEKYLQNLTDQEDKDGRFISEQAKADQHEKRNMFVDLHKTGLKDHKEWAAKQVYINLGFFLQGVGSLGLDAVPIEGFDTKVFDEEFKLKEKGLTSLVLVAVGHHADDDFNARLPKSRWEEKQIITEI